MLETNNKIKCQKKKKWVSAKHSTWNIVVGAFIGISFFSWGLLNFPRPRRVPGGLSPDVRANENAMFSFFFFLTIIFSFAVF